LTQDAHLKLMQLDVHNALVWAEKALDYEESMGSRLNAGAYFDLVKRLRSTWESIEFMITNGARNRTTR